MRNLPSAPRIVGRDPKDYAAELQDFLQRCVTAQDQNVVEVDEATGTLGLTPGTPTTIDAGSTGDAGAGPALAFDNHEHAVTTGSPVAVTVGAANTEGSGAALARASHAHALAGGTPVAVTVGAANAAGASANVARADHVHALAGGTPATVGTANAAGASADVARADHVHAQGIVTTNGDLLGFSTVPARIPGPTILHHHHRLVGSSDGIHAWGLVWDPTTSGDLVDAATTDVLHLSLVAAGAGLFPWAALTLRYAVEATDDTDSQIETGTVQLRAVRTSAGTITSALEVVPDPQVLSAGTLAVTWTRNDDAAGSRVTLRVNANTSLSPTAIYCTIWVTDLGDCGLELATDFV